MYYDIMFYGNISFALKLTMIKSGHDPAVASCGPPSGDNGAQASRVTGCGKVAG